MSIKFKNPSIQPNQTNKFCRIQSTDFIKAINSKIEKIHFTRSKNIISTIDRPKLHESYDDTISYYKRTGRENSKAYLEMIQYKNKVIEDQEKYDTLNGILDSSITKDDPTSATSRFVLSLHQAFDKHIPFSISPEVLWTIISGEVATYVKNNSTNTKIEKLFTTTPGEKQTIIIRNDSLVYNDVNQTNDWTGIINYDFKDELKKRVPSELMSLMLPKMSTSNEINDVVHMVSFMDAASKYYNYGVLTCCGIPEFKIEGEVQDWVNIKNSISVISEIIPDLKPYYQKGLSPIFDNIISVLEGNNPNIKFWESIYKIDGGSGGPYSNGWFNDLYAHLLNYNGKMVFKSKEEQYGRTFGFGGSKLNNFPSNISCVDFEWNYLGTKIPMSFVGGIDSVEIDEEGFLSPRLGFNVVELKKEENK